jgi:VIT1/CCC1 family predicted Fe2+/Mn2+ transporter
MILPDITSTIISQLNAMLTWGPVTTYLSIIIGASLFATVVGMVLWVLGRK